MVLVWIGIAIGVLLAITLIIKITKTSSYESLAINTHCKKCGYKINGLKCPRCEKHSFFSNKYK